MSNIIVGETHEFEFIPNKHKNLSNFFFKVLKNGIDTGYLIRVNIYGAISLPYCLHLDLSDDIRNKLISSAIKSYKMGLSF